MDELEISGKRYISTRRAAKENKYHSDYIGQLIRGGKVEGQKFGRSWYVVADSLAEYLGKEVPAKEVAVRTEVVVAEAEEIKEETPEVVERVVVAEKVLDEEAHHIPLTIRTSEIKVARNSLRYVADDGPLYPRVESYVQVMPRATESIISEEEVIEDEPTTNIQRPRGKNKMKLLLVRGGVLAVAGVVTLGVVVAASAFVVSNTTVKGETASISYSLQGL